ncbi:GNAT family N-acetyltransferase [Aerococcaceae bacterium WS4759]|uniref:GNAT family N-acetyltransferase n=1 Tax=Fundicoccus ignavus TaxID=2664442 RepID=A0A6I2GL98_9LACT|nr:GNAT family N-acetyltransferase [Fundicoccus ignavus]MRI86331.1 GNAT family N-acetyltransferase [Fundicoccus ignavus]
MIRKFQMEDINQVMKIWLDSNIDAHNFIKQEYWISNAPDVKKQLMNAEIYVYEQESKIVGFVGMQDNYLAGIFVDKDIRSNGIGKQILKYIKGIRQEFTLRVYKENKGAVNFYEREGLTTITEEMDEATNNIELLMQWKADDFYDSTIVGN